MSRQAALQFLAPSKLAVVLPLLERNLAKLGAQRAATPPPRASVAAVFRWREREQRTLELLLVRRSFNERDTWSGQVAFPGGKRQKTVLEGGDASKSAIKASESDDSVPWESPLETAQRETMEEIGLDLTASHVRFIGSLPAIQTHLRTFWVSTQVFLIETSAEEQAFTPTIQESEIADVFWVDVQELFNPKRCTSFAWPIEDMIRPLATRPRLKSWVEKYFGNLMFACIYLPRPTHAQPDEDVTQRHAFDFVLWGLTLRMIADLLKLAKVPLPINDVMPHFEKRLVGDFALFLYRYPDQALKRGAGVAALAAAVGFGYSHLTAAALDTRIFSIQRQLMQQTNLPFYWQLVGGCWILRKRSIIHLNRTQLRFACLGKVALHPRDDFHENLVVACDAEGLVHGRGCHVEGLVFYGSPVEEPQTPLKKHTLTGCWSVDDVVHKLEVVLREVYKLLRKEGLAVAEPMALVVHRKDHTPGCGRCGRTFQRAR